MNTTNARATFNWAAFVWTIAVWAIYFLLVKSVLHLAIPMGVYWPVIKEYWEIKFYIVLRFARGTWK